MRTLVSTLLLGVCLVSGPALAQQHPWVPSGMSTGSVSSGDAAARAYGRVTTGAIIDTAGSRSGRSGADDLYNSCNSGHAVFVCPGSGGQ
jgi:hypothetical protein